MLIKPLTLDVWGDFYALMNSDTQCTECWCLNHREESGCPTGIRAHDRMKELTGQDKVGGLLAYDGNECVGWISIDPLAELIGHDCQPSAKANDWAIHCLFIRETHRGRGLSGQLICAAVDYAKSRGAKICSAFPIPELNRYRFPPNEAEFSGRFATYSRLGFVPVGEPSDFYQRMEVQIS